MNDEINEKPIDISANDDKSITINNSISEKPPITNPNENNLNPQLQSDNNNYSNNDPRSLQLQNNTENERQDGDIQESNYNTLYETVCETLFRDLRRMLHKLEYVLLPRFSAEKGKELQNWELWGPLVICLLLCVTISLGNSATSTDKSFICIFVIIWIGGVVITFNAQFLGAKIGICQSICLLGYCVFPILIGAIINRLIGKKLAVVKVIVIALAVIWSCFSSVGFVSSLTTPQKKFITTYPIFLFFISLAMFVLNA
jgi:hypothetical protein